MTSIAPDPFLWTKATDWATDHAAPLEDVVRSIQQGTLPGECFAGTWYVARPTVTLHYRDPTDIRRAELHLLALQLGEYLTAARRSLVLPITADDPDFEESLRFLLECLQGPETYPVPFRLGGRHWRVDASLHSDLVLALMEFEQRIDRHLMGLDDDGPGANGTIARTDTARAGPIDPVERSRPSVYLDIPATRDGQYLKQGANVLRLEFVYDSVQCGVAWGALHEASADPHAGPVPIVLGRDTYFVDPSLHIELGAQLMVLMVDMDLGPLLALYPPDSVPDDDEEELLD